MTKNNTNLPKEDTGSLATSPVEEAKDATSTVRREVASGDEQPAAEASNLTKRIKTWRDYANNPLHNPCHAQTPGPRWKFEDGEKICDVGDSVLFNALLGYSGESAAIDAVRRSQDNSGRWWRSPLHVDDDGKPTHYPGSTYSFSKDHTLGILLYFVTTPDRDVARGQAKAWLHYMRKQGRVWDRLRIGPDIPESLVAQFAKSLPPCRDGLKAEGCAVREVVETTKEVWEKVGDCFLDPNECLTKVEKTVAEYVDREIGYWTHDVCPDSAASRCTITPGLWFLFHRVWRDSLGLAPSGSMRFADSVFDDLSYDVYIGWEAGEVDDYQLHLKAVNSLIRAILGKPAAVTITAVYRKRPDNPFFKYLMHKFVNNNLHPTAELRDELLALAPSEFHAYQKTDDSSGQAYDSFKDENDRDITGKQWAWQRDDFRNDVRDTCGWDCIFLGNLLTREFAIELDFYTTSVLPQLLSERRQVLNLAISRLKESFGIIRDNEREIDDYVERAVAVISHADVTVAELELWNGEIIERIQDLCPFGMRQLHNDYLLAREAHDALLRLQEESRRKFQDAERLEEFGEIWDSTMSSYVEVGELLQSVSIRLAGRTACLRLVQLLAAIPLRIEQEKVDGINDDLRDLSDEAFADLRRIARDLEYDKTKTELSYCASQLAARLRQNRIRRRYEASSETAGEVSDLFQGQFDRVAENAKLLTERELAEIREEAGLIIDREKELWQDFVTELGLQEIVLGRLNVINSNAASVYDAVREYHESHQKALYLSWRERSKEAGYRVPAECENAGESAFRKRACWQFAAPEDFASREEWILFDIMLNEIERFVADFEILSRLSEPEHSLLERQQFPATGVVFDVDVEGACTERIQTPSGVRLTNCRIRQRMELQAAPVSPSNGNSVIESLTFFNRIVIISHGESLEPSSITWRINGQRGNQAVVDGGRLAVDVPVSYRGARLTVDANGLDEWNVFKPGTKVEVLVNYQYPDVYSLSAYARNLSRFAKIISRVFAQLAPGNTQNEVIASLDEGMEVFAMLLDRGDLDAISRHQIETALDRIETGRSLITQVCSEGGPELCSGEIRKARESLSAIVEKSANELLALQRFVEAEIVRLMEVDESLGARVQRILDELTPPERISGLKPFLAWVPRTMQLERRASTEEEFFRGRLIRLRLEDLHDEFTEMSESDQLRKRFGAIEGPYGRFILRKGFYQRMSSDQSETRPSLRGPHFKSDGDIWRARRPGIEERYYTHEYGMKLEWWKEIISGERLRELVRARRHMVIKYQIRYAVRPAAHRRGVGDYPTAPRSSIGFNQAIRFQVGREGTLSRDSILHSQYKAYDNHDWRGEEVSFEFELGDASLHRAGGGLALRFSFSWMREINILSLTWQLLNPF